MTVRVTKKINTFTLFYSLISLISGEKYENDHSFDSLIRRDFVGTLMKKSDCGSLVVDHPGKNV